MVGVHSAKRNWKIEEKMNAHFVASQCTKFLNPERLGKKLRELLSTGIARIAVGMREQEQELSEVQNERISGTSMPEMQLSNA